MKSKLNIILPVVLLLLEGYTLYAQPVGQTVCIQRMMKQLAHKGLPITVAGEYPLTGLCNGKKMEVEVSGEVFTHISLRLFDKKIKKEYPTPIYNFIERYLLELLLCENTTEAIRQMKIDGVSLKINGKELTSKFNSIASVLQLIDESTPFLMKTDDQCYEAGWIIGNQWQIALRFKKQYELIEGKDKKEMEMAFYPQLQKYTAPQAKALKVDPSELKETEKIGIYLQQGDHYIIPTMNSNRYYKKSAANAFTLLFDDAYVNESLTNLFSSAEQMKTKATLNIEHRCYGNTIKKYNCPLSKWCTFARDQHSQIYVGIEEYKKDKITGTVLIINKELMYNHVLYFECPVTIFTNQENTSIKTILYTYVPTHNIENLFDTNQQTEKKNLDILRK